MSGTVVVNQPGVYFVDADGNTLCADDGATISSHEGIIVAGKDGSVIRFVRVASDGTLRVDPTGTTTQPISASSLPLPTGAATEATLAAVATETKLEAVRVLLASLDTKDYATQTTLASLLSAFNAEDFATETTLVAADAKLSTIDSVLDSIKDVDGIADLNKWLGSSAPTVGQKTMADSIPIAIASNQTIIPISDGGGSLTVDTPQLPTSLVGGRLTTNLGSWLGSISPTVGQKTMTNSIPIAIALDQTVIPISDDGGSITIDDGGGTITVDGTVSVNQPVSVDDNGGSLTVDGTVTSNAGTGPWPVTDNGGSLTIDDGGGSITTDTSQLPASLVGGRLTTNIGSWFGSTTPTVGQKIMANSIPVTLSSDQSAIAVTTGSTVGTGAVSQLLTNGSSSDMVVNGSGTPVEFTFDADATEDIQILSLRFVISLGGAFDFDGNTFGEGGGALSNGVEVEVTANNGSFSKIVSTFNVNEDFARLLDFQPFADIDAVITASLPFGGNVILEAGSSDQVVVRINDNVALGTRGIDYFTATIYGVEI